MRHPLCGTRRVSRPPVRSSAAADPVTTPRTTEGAIRCRAPSRGPSDPRRTGSAARRALSRRCSPARRVSRRYPAGTRSGWSSGRSGEGPAYTCGTSTPSRGPVLRTVKATSRPSAVPARVRVRAGEGRVRQSVAEGEQRLYALGVVPAVADVEALRVPLGAADARVAAGVPGDGVVIVAGREALGEAAPGRRTGRRRWRRRPPGPGSASGAPRRCAPATASPWRTRC